MRHSKLRSRRIYQRTLLRTQNTDPKRTTTAKIESSNNLVGLEVEVAVETAGEIFFPGGFFYSHHFPLSL